MSASKYSARAALKKSKDAGRKCFVPYITAGDPSLERTAEYVRAFARAGADVIELGVPFSDPMADGPVNQRSAERALESGTTLTKILELVRKLRDEGLATPIVLFTYYNPVYVMGAESFAKRAAQAGVSAVLALDLPPEEAESHCKALEAQGVETVFLAAPTTPPERLADLSRHSTGFLYYVSRTGVTGVQNAVSETLGRELEAVRARVDAPVAVGFGIATPAHAAEVARHADAVVVGSAIVQRIADGADAAAIEKFARELVKGIRGE